MRYPYYVAKPLRFLSFACARANEWSNGFRCGPHSFARLASSSRAIIASKPVASCRAMCGSRYCSNDNEDDDSGGGDKDVDGSRQTSRESSAIVLP